MRLRVLHALYGCDTGCCGHLIEFYPDDGLAYTSFNFGHAPEDPEEARAWARTIAEDFIRLHHPECLDSIDWGSLEIDARSSCSCYF